MPSPLAANSSLAAVKSSSNISFNWGSSRSDAMELASCCSSLRLVRPCTSRPTPNRLDTPVRSLPSYPASMFFSWAPMILSWISVWVLLSSFNNPLRSSTLYACVSDGSISFALLPELSKIRALSTSFAYSEYEALKPL